MTRKNNFDGLSKLAKVKRVVEAQTAVRDRVNVVVAIAKSRYHLLYTEFRSQNTPRKQEASKRQRTASNSPSPSNDQPRFAQQNESDDGTNTRNGGAKRIRGAAAHNHREKELRDEKERIRAEAASKRRNRADRRRIDGMLSFMISS
jgi:hypothetical protein